MFKNLARYRSENNFIIRPLKFLSRTFKQIAFWQNFDILANLSVFLKNFDDLIKLFLDLYLAKFLTFQQNSFHARLKNEYFKLPT